MTTDKLTDEKINELREAAEHGANGYDSQIASVCRELLRLRAGLNRTKELREGWLKDFSDDGDAKLAAVDEILKGFEL